MAEYTTSGETKTSSCKHVLNHQTLSFYKQNLHVYNMVIDYITSQIDHIKKFIVNQMV